MATLDLTLNAKHCAIGISFARAPIIDDLKGKASPWIAEYCDLSDGFASRPLPDLLEAVAQQVSVADRCRISEEYHGSG
jgi:hypothetical protein